MDYNFKYDSYLISIIVPCYNQGHYLNRCLQSISTQTFKNWECIVIDDGSNDNTKSVAENWTKKDKRFKYYYRNNGGLSAARNDGMKHCTGSHIFFIDADDRLTHDRVLERFTTNNNEYDVITANFNLEYIDKIIKAQNLNPTIIETELNDEKILWHYLNRKISAPACNKLFNKTFLDTFNIRFVEGVLHEDELWSIDVFSKANRILLLSDITYNYFKENPNSIVTTYNENKFDSLIYILSTFHDRLLNDDLSLKQKQTIINHFSYLSQFLTKKKLIDRPDVWKNKYNRVREIFIKLGFEKHSFKYKLNQDLAYFLVRNLQHSKTNILSQRIINKIKYETLKFII